MLRFVLGGAGCGKSAYLMNETGKLSENGRKIIFIVPEQFSFESDKKIYKAIGAKKFNNILSLSFTSLAKEIFEQFGGRSGEYAEDIHKYILMNRAVRKVSVGDGLSYYKRQSKKISFVNDALNIITEFRQCGVSPEDLQNLSCAGTGGSEKLIDLSLIYSEYDSLLKENHLKDSLSDISEAAAAANINDYFRDKTVIFDEFESFTGDELELIDAVLAQASDVYVSLRLEGLDDTEKKYGIFDSVLKTYHRLVNIAKKYNIDREIINLDKPLKYKGDDLAFLNKNIMRSGGRTFENSENIEIICCRDMYAEAEYVCAKINELIRDKGYKYRDIAIISRQLDEYVFILEAAFRRYDIPCFMDVKKNAFHTVVMQLVLNTVNVVCCGKPDTETMLRYIKTSLQFDINSISRLENYCFEWGITGDDWFRPFTKGIENDPYLEEMRKSIAEPVAECRRSCRDADSGEICRNIYGLLFKTGAPIRLAETEQRLMEAGFVFEAKEQKRMWDTLMNIFDIFCEMGSDITREEFSELLPSVLQNITYSLPPQKLDTVHAAKAETARLDSPKAVFVIGVNEGYFPGAVSQSGLLNDKDRLKFRDAGLHLSRDTEELAADERLVVYKSLTHASEKLYITYPTLDNSGRGRFRSTVLNDITAMFGKETERYASDIDAEFYCSTKAAAFYNYVQNYGMNDKGIREIEQVLSEDSVYADKIRFLKALSEDRELTVEDKELMRRLFTERLRLSPTDVEKYNLCHFRYFSEKGLGLYPLKKREISNPEVGIIVHECLERIISSCGSNDELQALKKEDILDLTGKTVDSYVEQNMPEGFGSDLRNLRYMSNIKKSVAGIVEHLQKEFAQSEFYPAEFEYVVNKSGEGILKASNGVEIILNGKIDRVDTLEKDGKKYVRIVDYKTGHKVFSFADINYGLNMQMLIYLFSITGEKEKYRDYEPAGVLYMPSGEIGCSRDRDSGEDLETFLSKSMKMNGVVLKDRTVLSAMEKEIKGVYIPAKLLKADSGSGEPSLDSHSSALDAKQFSKLREYVEDTVRDLADRLYEGDIGAVPMYFSDEMTACGNCVYASVCGHEPHDRYREMDGKPGDIAEEFKAKLSES